MIRQSIALASSLYLALIPSLHAQDVEVLGRDVPRNALVVGNQDYTGNTRDLPNAAADAALISDTLADLGFQVTSIVDAPQAELNKTLLDFANSLPQGGIALIYFAGHGVQWQGENYFIPVDAQPAELSDLQLLSVSASLLMQLLAERDSIANIFIFDACRNNPFERAANRTFGEETQIKGLAATKVRFTGSLVAYSTAPGEVSSDGEPGGHSPYADSLSQALRRPGLGIEAVFKLTRSLVIGKTEHAQIPWENSSLVRDIYLLPENSHSALEPNECDLLAGHPSDPERLSAGVPYDLLRPAVAIPACRAALEKDQDNPRIITELARALSKAGQYEEALALNLKAAKMGYTAAYHNIGNHFRQGAGVERDLNVALDWFLRAGEKGHPEDAYNAGVIFAQGTEFFPPDYGKALLWLNRAAQQDYPSAFNRLGLLYRDGRGVTQDVMEANKYFEKGVQLGDASAMVNLATSYLKGTGVDIDYAKAYDLFRRAAQLRRITAYTNLGDMYRKAQGRDRNLREAAFWYGLAARGGHSYSQERYQEIIDGFGAEDRAVVEERIQLWVDSDFG